MRSFRKFALAIGLSALFIPITLAQLPAISIDSVETETQMITTFGNQSQTEVVGAPYSAIEESLYSQKQPDGTYEGRSSVTTNTYRDGEGRTRAERYVTSYLPGAGKPGFRSIYITDPVAGILYRLDPENHRATRSPWNANTQAIASQANTAKPVASAGEPQPTLITESLGIKTIEGLTVEGTRQTLVVTINAEGSDHPYHVVVETWSSQELKVAVMSTRDTSGGKRTTRLTKISRAEPDVTLFSVPPNYSIEDAPTGEGTAFTAVP